MKQYFIELIGTMFLVLTAGLSGNPIAIGLMYSAMIYLGSHISQGYFNPAVSLTFFLRGRFGSGKLIVYWIFQILGAFIGALIFYLIQGKTFAPIPGQGIAEWKAILVEFLFTFILCAVVLSTTISVRSKGNYVYGIVIGLVLLACIYTGGAISGGAFNPAVALGPEIMDMIIGGNLIKYFYIYLIGCLLGGIFATIIYNYLNSEEKLGSN